MSHFWNTTSQDGTKEKPDEKDFKIRFSEIPIKQGLVLPLYLGFDSEEAKQFFKDSKYTILSEERARLDD